ncbi:MAG: hypothetical protein PHF00_01335 [Elusimicrobia bacterium]|nr:hypothetical protein [Elusimicrobiota bacterium]
MRIAICQLDMAWEDKAATKKKILSLLSDCSAKDGIDWMVFPEMTLSGFSMDPLKTALDASDLSFFSDLARRHRMCVTFGGAQAGRNNLLTMDKEGALFASYSKLHLFSLTEEDKAYLPGSRQINFIIQGMSVVPAVCFDLRFPYLFWNAAARADLYVVIASWPARRAEHWTRLLQARAIENQAYVVGVNRTGRDPRTEYCGNSMIYDPLGRVVLDCREAEAVFVAAADVGRDLVLATRAKLPFLRDRRTDIASA